MPASTSSSRTPRRVVRTTSVIAAGDGLAPPAAPTTADIESALHAAVVSAREEITRAERALGRSRVARARAGLDLEVHARPFAIDEAGRERLRAAYAAADADVAAKRAALEDAREFERAARTVASGFERRAGREVVATLTAVAVAASSGERVLSRVTAEDAPARAAASALSV